MSIESDKVMADFCLACASHRGIQSLLFTNPTSSDLAHAMKKLAFRQVTSFLLEEHHFMVTLLDTIDWDLLAEKVLANYLCKSPEPAQLVNSFRAA